MTVDDSRIIRRIVAGVIQEEGYDPVEAQHGAEALELLQRHDDVALVVLDWNMPVMDGMECLRRIRSDATFEGIPVLMLTTEAERSSMVTAIRNGASNYLSKPFSTEGLSAKIQQCLGRG